MEVILVGQLHMRKGQLFIAYTRTQPPATPPPLFGVGGNPRLLRLQKAAEGARGIPTVRLDLHKEKHVAKGAGKIFADLDVCVCLRVSHSTYTKKKLTEAKERDSLTSTIKQTNLNRLYTLSDTYGVGSDNSWSFPFASWGGPLILRTS